ncbi:M16 family metallopeptidase [Patescibacteria group bacterium]
MFKKLKLKNGLDVIVAPQAETEVVTLMIMFGVGSRFESKQNLGISHFLEHMMFKGTTRRPSNQIISKKLDTMGAIFNAFTGKDMTAYYIKVRAEHLPEAIDLLSDMMLHSKFPAAMMEKEKGVILEEINMYEDNPLMYIEDVFEETLFGNQPLGRNIAGTRESITKMTRAQFVSYVNKFYHTGNAVLGFAGAVDTCEAEKYAQKFLAKMKKSSPNNPSKVTLKDTKKSIKIIYRQSEQTHLALGFPAYSYAHPDRIALDILSVILGGSMSSRLFEVIREKHGMAYYIRSSISHYKDTGTFAVYSGLDNTRVPKAISLITKEFKKLVNKNISPAELNKAKEYLKGHMAINMEDSENIVNWVNKQYLMTGKLQTINEKMAEIDKVTSSDLKRVAKDVLKASKMNLAMIGPIKDKKKFSKLLTL